jgi:hypothetical protein
VIPLAQAVARGAGGARGSDLRQRRWRIGLR